MKVNEFDATIEKDILTGMIVDDTVCGRVAEKWHDDGLFRIRWTNLVGRWCVKYYRKYRKAPNGDIERIFESWANKNDDEDTVGLVDDFLADLSGAYDEEADDINPEYLVDKAAEHFNAVRLEQMATVVQGHVKSGEVMKAMDTVATWDKVEMGTGAGVDVFHDRDAIMAAFESTEEPLIKYSGALGKFFGSQLGRDEFVAFTGATGRGKTWWLLDVAWQAMRQGNRVAFFEVGDMSQNQIMKRFMCRVAGKPLRPPYEVEIPVEITKERDSNMAEVETEIRKYKGPLQAEEAWKACEKRMRRNNKPLLKLSVHPNNSLNVDGITSILNVWERDGWTPDVIVVDYADVLAPLPGYQVGDREAINATWKALRGLSQIKHALVVTATQADANSYSANTLSQSNFSDDRRKNDHVTAMLGINQTPAEKALGVCRLNWTKRREEAYSERSCVHVAGCLNIGRPCIKSTF